MPIKIEVVDEFNELECVIGNLPEQNLKQLIDKAQSLDMACIPFIDLVGKTIFGGYQACRIKGELEVLRQYPELNQKTLDLIAKGVDETILYDHHYLKFTSVP